MTLREHWRFAAIGTEWLVETPDRMSDAVRRDVASVISSFDETWSRFRADSLVARLARDGGEAPAPGDARVMLDAYTALSEATAGAVQPLVGDALAQRGYDADFSLVDRGARSAPSDWRAQLTWDDERLALRRPALIDVGAVGKGHLVDLVAALLRRAGHRVVVVDAGGDMAMHGVRERIGLEHPFDARRVLGVWEVEDAALCASATNRRAWGDGLHHVLDARTGEPVRAIAATWAVAATALRADAIATALFFDGGPRLAHEWGVHWVRMMTDGRVEWSPGCRAELFAAGSTVEP
ncbi:FAD:protein FMN transferase [Microbacterium sp. NPDC055910]|uniref:FAD:protein FMN transferase n=1 Tax=Microbacterium sp. NPDC055910 TaxID=3345659 RepID=UPI0035DCA163